MERTRIQSAVPDIPFFLDVFMWKKSIEKPCRDPSGWVVTATMLFHLDPFEELCGNRRKGFKTVDSQTGPRVEGFSYHEKARHFNSFYLFSFYHSVIPL